MSSQNIFFDEWRACLRSHFFYVVRIKDAVTLPTLRQVLLDAGVTEKEIEQWYADATKEAEQMISDQE